MQLTKLSNLFDIRYGTSEELINMEESLRRDGHSICFVSRTENNNGVSAFVGKKSELVPMPANTLSVAVSGSVLSTFLQPYEYYTGFHVLVLSPRINMSERELIYYSICIKKNKYKYSYGRQANKTLKDLLVPNSVPEKFLNLKIEELKKDPVANKKISLGDREWDWFSLRELFDIKKGKRLTKQDMRPGKTPFIGSSELENGVTAYIDKEPIHKANTISVTYNGSVAEAFYQPRDYWASDDVNVLYARFPLNPYIALFIIPLIRKEKYRFSYGRKWHLERMNESKIKLPVDKDGVPDWKFMEDYVKSLPYSAGI